MGCKAAEHDNLQWVTGHHVLVRFARRPIAQRCCAALRHGKNTWQAQWWSGDKSFAEWQLKNLAKVVGLSSCTPVSVRKAKSPTSVTRPLPQDTKNGATQAVGGRWSTLLQEEEEEGE